MSASVRLARVLTKVSLIRRFDTFDAMAEFVQFGALLPDDLVVPLGVMAHEEYERAIERFLHKHPDRKRAKSLVASLEVETGGGLSLKTMALSVAAARVTLLKRLGYAASIGKALDKVARASGLPRGAIKNFRDNLNRGLYPPSATKYYKDEIDRHSGAVCEAEILDGLHLWGAHGR